MRCAFILIEEADKRSAIRHHNQVTCYIRLLLRGPGSKSRESQHRVAFMATSYNPESLVLLAQKSFEGFGNRKAGTLCHIVIASWSYARIL